MIYYIDKFNPVDLKNIEYYPGDKFLFEVAFFVSFKDAKECRDHNKKILETSGWKTECDFQFFKVSGGAKIPYHALILELIEKKKDQ